MSQSTSEPEFKASIGLVNVTVWKKLHNDRAFYSTDITRSYKDKNGEWANGTSFNHEDLLNVARLAERAEQFIAREKEE
jgi:hypothetical protein